MSRKNTSNNNREYNRSLAQRRRANRAAEEQAAEAEATAFWQNNHAAAHQARIARQDATMPEALRNVMSR